MFINRECVRLIACDPTLQQRCSRCFSFHGARVVVCKPRGSGGGDGGVKSRKGKKKIQENTLSAHKRGRRTRAHTRGSFTPHAPVASA